MWALYLVSKCLPRVCMGGSLPAACVQFAERSAPRVHGWFLLFFPTRHGIFVCPACAWVVPSPGRTSTEALRLPRVCMGGSC